MIIVIVIGMASVCPMVVKPDRKNISGIVWGKIGNAEGLFNGNIFYPYKNVLPYSEMFYLSSLVSWIGTGCGKTG